MTAEPVPGPYAGAVSRLAAYVVDLTLMSTTLSMGSAVAAYVIAVTTGYEPRLADDRDVASLGLVVWWLVYFGGSWAVTGRTLGMALLGVRVTGDDGSRVSARAAFVRAATFPLSVALFGLGFLGILFDRRRRALHDLFARTTVVYTTPPPVPAPPVTVVVPPVTVTASAGGPGGGG